MGDELDGERDESPDLDDHGGCPDSGNYVGLRLTQGAFSRFPRLLDLLVLNSYCKSIFCLKSVGIAMRQR